MSNNRPLYAHLSMFLACAIWGLMSPIGKDAMTHGFDGIVMVSFRVAGGALLFWLTSLFLPKEHVATRDKFISLRTGVQPMLFYHRTEYHLPRQCEHSHHINAYLRHASLFPHTS